MKPTSRNIIITICSAICMLAALQYLSFIPNLEFAARISFTVVVWLAAISIFALPIVAISWLVAMMAKDKPTVKITGYISIVMLSSILSLFVCLAA